MISQAGYAVQVRWTLLETRTDVRGPSWRQIYVKVAELKKLEVWTRECSDAAGRGGAERPEKSTEQIHGEALRSVDTKQLVLSDLPSVRGACTATKHRSEGRWKCNWCAKWGVHAPESPHVRTHCGKMLLPAWWKIQIRISSLYSHWFGDWQIRICLLRRSPILFVDPVLVPSHSSRRFDYQLMVWRILNRPITSDLWSVLECYVC